MFSYAINLINRGISDDLSEFSKKTFKFLYKFTFLMGLGPEKLMGFIMEFSKDGKYFFHYF